MINAKGRIQRLNRAVHPPAAARDDWEILRDLLVAVSGQNEWGTIEAVFAAMALAHKDFEGLSLSKIGDLGLEILSEKPLVVGGLLSQ